jgi:hypothetical protein
MEGQGGELTLCSPHLLLNPAEPSAYHSHPSSPFTYSLIFSVMFTIFAIFHALPHLTKVPLMREISGLNLA